jgi:hypothetical protein
MQPGHVRLRKVVLNANGLTDIEMRRLSLFSFSIGAEFTSTLSVPTYKSLKGSTSTHSVVSRKLNVCGHVFILLSFSSFWYVDLSCELVQEFCIHPV